MCLDGDARDNDRERVLLMRPEVGRVNIYTL